MAGSRTGRAPGAEGPAVEVVQLSGVLCVIVRRFQGDEDDRRLLTAWAARGAEDLRADRVLVDLRGNTGGNDQFLYDWIDPVVSAGTLLPGTDQVWTVGDRPVGLWNHPALLTAASGAGQVPQWLREQSHVPSPEDVQRIVTDPGDEPIGQAAAPWPGRMLVVVDRATRSSGESAAWALRHALGARVVGARTAGMIEYGNVVPYLLPASGLHVVLPTKHNDFGIPVEQVGMPVDYEIDTTQPLADLAVLVR